MQDVPAPKPQALASEDHPFKMLVTTLEADNFLGRILTGRIESGAITVNRQIKVLNRAGEIVEKTRVTKLLAFRGLARVPVERAEAGELLIKHIADIIEDRRVIAEEGSDIAVEHLLDGLSHQLQRERIAGVALHQRGRAGLRPAQPARSQQLAANLLAQAGQRKAVC